MTLLTKSAHVKNLLDLDHRGNTIFSWSLNPQEIVTRFERRTPAVEARIDAMRKCADVGYPIRAVVMPVIPTDNWQQCYDRFLTHLLHAVPLQRITFGGICSYPSAKTLMEDKVGKHSEISRALASHQSKSSDGRTRFPASLRVNMYRFLIGIVRHHAPRLEVSLCLEEPGVFAALHLASTIGHCNCVL
jgi:spore photoproduct lyase